jgi:ABC-type dipeptide/oligopeptide/nickel transport systems, permease components
VSRPEPRAAAPVTAPPTAYLPAAGTGAAGVGGPFGWLRRPKRATRRGKAFFVFGVVWISLLVLAALFADVIPGLPHFSEKIGTFAQGPDFSSLGGLLGTDSVGRSNLSRIIFGARTSLTIAVASTLIGLFIGVVLGMLAGYYRGFWDGLGTIVANALSALPPLIMLLALVAAVGASLWGITVSLGILIADLYIRVTKGAVLSNAQREYVLAARSLGATDARILFREILPNLIPTLAAVIPISMAVLVVVEGSLSFLGYGIPAPNPSWGGMIAAGADVIRRFPGVMVAPVVTLFLTVFSFNAIGDYLGSRTDRRDAQI